MLSIILNTDYQNKGGKIMCRVCGNTSGVRWTRNNRGNDCSRWTDRITCICGSTEKRFRNTGEIIEQTIIGSPLVK